MMHGTMNVKKKKRKKKKKTSLLQYLAFGPGFETGLPKYKAILPPSKF